MQCRLFINQETTLLKVICWVDLCILHSTVWKETVFPRPLDVRGSHILAANLHGSLACDCDCNAPIAKGKHYAKGTFTFLKWGQHIPILLMAIIMSLSSLARWLLYKRDTPQKGLNLSLGPCLWCEREHKVFKNMPVALWEQFFITLNSCSVETLHAFLFRRDARFSSTMLLLAECPECCPSTYCNMFFCNSKF